LFIALLYVIFAILKGKSLIPRGFFIPWILYTLSILISTLISIDLKESLDGMRSEYLKQMIVFGFLMIPAAAWTTKRLTVLSAFLLSGLVMCTIGFFPYFIGFMQTGDHRLVSLSGSYTRIAYFYVMYVPFLILLYPDKKSRASFFLSGLLLLSLASVFVTRTRGAWVTVPLVMVMICILTRKWRTLITILLILFLVMGTFFVFSPTLRKRAGDFSEIMDISGSFGERINLWKSAQETIKDYPVFGRGYGKYIFVKIYKEHPQEGVESRSDTHNTVLEILIQRGVLGLISTFFIYLYFLKRAWGIRRSPWGRLYFAYFVSISVAFALFSLVDNIYVKETGRYLWQLAALGFSEKVTGMGNPEQKVDSNKE
jgi:O-antigen ligase